jgi:hypothetical protein
MRRLNLIETEHLCGLRLVGAVGDKIHDRLKRNFRHWELKRSRHNRTGKHAEKDAAWDLEDRLQRERPTATEEADEVHVSTATGHGE